MDPQIYDAMGQFFFLTRIVHILSRVSTGLKMLPTHTFLLSQGTYILKEPPITNQLEALYPRMIPSFAM